MAAEIKGKSNKETTKASQSEGNSGVPPEVLEAAAAAAAVQSGKSEQEPEVPVVTEGQIEHLPNTKAPVQEAQLEPIPTQPQLRNNKQEVKPGIVSEVTLKSQGEDAGVPIIGSNQVDFNYVGNKVGQQLNIAVQDFNKIGHLKESTLDSIADFRTAEESLNNTMDKLEGSSIL